MTIEEIVKAYGLHADYYDPNSGRTYHIPRYTYNSEIDETSIPVSVDGRFIGMVRIKGNIEDIT